MYNIKSIYGKVSTNRVANSTPIVLLLSKLNSLRVNLESRLDFPTPESPISTTATCNRKHNELLLGTIHLTRHNNHIRN